MVAYLDSSATVKLAHPERCSEDLMAWLDSQSDLETVSSVQDSSGGRPANQFPMDPVANGQAVAGNLMTNAPVKSADASGLVATLPGGDVTVKCASGIRIVHQAPGAATDVKAGAKVLVLSRGPAALNIGVYS